jgi:hypothetical protein
LWSRLQGSMSENSQPFHIQNSPISVFMEAGRSWIFAYNVDSLHYSKFWKRKFLIFFFLLIVQCLVLQPFHSIGYLHNVHEGRRTLEGRAYSFVSCLIAETSRISTKFCSNRSWIIFITVYVDLAKSPLHLKSESDLSFC